MPVVVRPDMLGPQLAQELRYRIIRGTYPAGMHLVETDLSAEFDVSRGPVRDALRILETEGLLTSRRRGVFVRGLPAADVTELYTVRAAIEQLAVDLVIQRTRQPDWAGYDQLVEEMRKAAEARDPARFAVADLAFHTLFYSDSENRRLLGFWQQIQPTFAVMLKVTTQEERDLYGPAESHSAILEAAKRGDRDGAITEMRKHLDEAHQRLVEARESVTAEPVTESLHASA